MAKNESLPEAFAIGMAMEQFLIDFGSRDVGQYRLLTRFTNLLNLAATEYLTGIQFVDYEVTHRSSINIDPVF